ncbi:hypothetical protein OKW76_15470 [Sphingomonas sp. S1-29]|uniref:hypothetical protein n=1 Tax=Sphingomonas sp. S1-29 TaxID=2991074 RepID=UPI00223EA1F2|nr:hypothetical protein [Sphingomonas sp. S1-29]UZK69388.1 hypothetical protein OKW76_15470 [Sphingomonas sp. S1-29]
MSINRLALAALPALALLGACGADPANDIVTTNTGNVVPSETQENMTFENDAVNNTLADDQNAMMSNDAVATDGTYGGMTDATGNGM